MLVIDGYNLLRAIQNLTEHSSNITDVQLCQIVDEYLYRIKKRGSIVFDGVGPREKEAFNNLRNLEVVFSGTSHEADDVIEKLVRQSSAPKMLTVVSNDRRIKAAAKKRKATTVDCVDFWMEVLKTIEKKRKRQVEPQGKFIGISEAETEYWLREFGLLK